MNWISFAHEQLRAVLQPGDKAIDATLGNGHDAAFLCQQVGPNGAVFGFDIQEEALRETRARLPDCDQLHLYLASHSSMLEHLDPALLGQVKAVMFNLGYLPGHEHAITTQPATTRSAIEAALQLLAPGGRLSIVLYTGHEGGAEEAAEVEALLVNLDRRAFTVSRHQTLNAGPTAPYCILVCAS